MEAMLNELQTQLTAVQAALEGNLQSNLFQLHSLNDLPDKDINERLSRFKTLATCHGWSNTKRVNVLQRSLGGPAESWFDNQSPGTIASFKIVTDGLKARVGSQTPEVLFRQDLYARKQGPKEPLSLYTEDIIKKSKHLALSDNTLMSVISNGVCNEIKNHVILNQPKSLAEAENLASLREAVSRHSGVSSSLGTAHSNLQEQRM